MGDEEKTAEQDDARSFEERVFARFDALDARFSSLEEKAESLNTRLSGLEEKVDRRLHDTRPIWENVQTELRRINSKLDQVIADLFETRANQTSLNRRVDEIEASR